MSCVHRIAVVSGAIKPEDVVHVAGYAETVVAGGAARLVPGGYWAIGSPRTYYDIQPAGRPRLMLDSMTCNVLTDRAEGEYADLELQARWERERVTNYGEVVEGWGQNKPDWSGCPNGWEGWARHEFTIALAVAFSLAMGEESALIDIWGEAEPDANDDYSQLVRAMIDSFICAGVGVRWRRAGDRLTLAPKQPAAAADDMPKTLETFRSHCATAVMIITPQILIESRKAQGLTQASLAKRAGVSVGTISKIESGGHTTSERTLRKVAAGLGFISTAEGAIQ